jgi:hypothetical protein
MNAVLMTGTRIVILALIFYSIGVFIEQRKQSVTKAVLLTLTIGILLDIGATVLMILGSPNSPFTLHGFLGYSALIAMLVDTLLIWRFWLGNTPEIKVPRQLHLYSRFAYSWWVLAFITGGVLVALKYA